MKKKVSRFTFSAAQLHAACDELATPARGTKPLASLARAALNLEPYIKEQMPSTKGLARDPLDAVAYANPLGYLPEIRALADKGADDHGLLAWTARMETIAVYCAARVLERVGTPGPAKSKTPSTRKSKSKTDALARKPETMKSLTVEDEGTRVIAGDLTVTGDVRNGGVLVVLGRLVVSGVIWDRSPDCHLVVLGTATARAANLSGGLAVRGDLGCSTALYAYDHGNTLYVGGSAVAPLVILDDKSLRAKRVTAHLKLDSRALRPATIAKAKQLLLPELFRDDEDEALPFDLEVLLPRVMKGQALWQAR